MPLVRSLKLPGEQGGCSKGRKLDGVCVIPKEESSLVFVLTLWDRVTQHQRHSVVLSLEELVVRRQEDEGTHLTCLLKELN